MSTVTAVEDEYASRSQCWCCGKVEPPDKLIHLCDRPEVTVCAGCAHWLHRQGREVEDRSRTGPVAGVKGRARYLRRKIAGRGWHRLPTVGAALRKLGRYPP